MLTRYCIAFLFIGMSAESDLLTTLCFSRVNRLSNGFTFAFSSLLCFAFITRRSLDGFPPPCFFLLFLDIFKLYFELSFHIRVRCALSHVVFVFILLHCHCQCRLHGKYPAGKPPTSILSRFSFISFLLLINRHRTMKESDFLKLKMRIG